MDGTRAAEVLPLLQERLAILPGGRDRRGGPVLVFPTTPRRERAKPEDYRRLLQYLLAIPNDEARGLGFTVVIDMRGATWGTVKPILKVCDSTIEDKSRVYSNYYYFRFRSFTNIFPALFT